MVAPPASTADPFETCYTPPVIRQAFIDLGIAYVWVLTTILVLIAAVLPLVIAAYALGV